MGMIFTVVGTYFEFFWLRDNRYRYAQRAKVLPI